MQVSDALKDIIERVTLDSQGLHGHASLDPPKGLSSVHFTFCPLSCGPQGPRGPPGDGVMGGDKEWTDGRRRLCVCKVYLRVRGVWQGCSLTEQVLHEMRGGVSVSLEQVLLIATAPEPRPLCIRPPQPNTHTHTHTNDNGFGVNRQPDTNGSEDSSTQGLFQLLVIRTEGVKHSLTCWHAKAFRQCVWLYAGGHYVLHSHDVFTYSCNILFYMYRNHLMHNKRVNQIFILLI